MNMLHVSVDIRIGPKYFTSSPMATERMSYRTINWRRITIGAFSKPVLTDMEASPGF